jgi:hypothetical protein
LDKTKHALKMRLYRQVCFVHQAISHLRIPSEKKNLTYVAEENIRRNILFHLKADGNSALYSNRLWLDYIVENGKSMLTKILLK